MNDPLVCLTEIEWREVGEEAATEGFWPRNKTCPTPGEVRWANLTRLEYSKFTPDIGPDGAVETGQRWWLFFQPGLSLLNGFCEHPEEMDASAVVEAEVLEVIVPHGRSLGGRGKQGMGNVWARVRCQQVILLAHIPDVFPLIPPPYKRAYELLRADVSATVTSFQTRTPEVHEWFMVTNASASRRMFPHLVLAGVSLDSFCEIVNWPVEVDKESWKMR